MNPSFCCADCSFTFRLEGRFLGRRVRCTNSQCKQAKLLDTDASGSGDGRRAVAIKGCYTVRILAAWMIVAFGATLLLDETALGGYWFRNQQAGVTIIHSSNDSAAIGGETTDTSLSNSRNQQAIHEKKSPKFSMTNSTTSTALKFITPADQRCIV